MKKHSGKKKMRTDENEEHFMPKYDKVVKCNKNNWDNISHSYMKQHTYTYIHMCGYTIPYTHLHPLIRNHEYACEYVFSFFFFVLDFQN